MSRLQRCRGHFYNWYDTRDLRPLDPRYVSSVDSGNLAGHLIALANTCREWIDAPLVNRLSCVGVLDALHLARGAFQGLPDELRTNTTTCGHLEHALRGPAAALAGETERADCAT